jgi:uncharacterized protein YndB with AHSA1/START domain
VKDISRSSDSIVFECDLAEPPEKVWRALTQPELLTQWLMPSDDEIAERSADQSVPVNRSAPIECEVLAAEPNRFLRYKWRETERGKAGEARETVDSIVTFELSVMPTGGTHLRLVHSDFVIVAFTQSRQVVAFGPTLMSGAARARTRSSSRSFERRSVTPITSGFCQIIRKAA